jgi:hypothetical protein
MKMVQADKPRETAITELIRAINSCNERRSVPFTKKGNNNCLRSFVFVAPINTPLPILILKASQTL